MTYSSHCKSIPVPSEFMADPGAWLAAQAKQPGMDIVLAQADDGVIWGKVDGGQLKLAGNAHPEVKVEFRAVTLQQARLFGPAGELYVWRTADGFAARMIADGNNPSDDDCLEDRQWLWGTLGDKGKAQGGFTLLVEGRQGLRHAPPITGLGQEQRVMLTARHYLDYDDEGQAYIAGSRLTGLVKVEEK